MNYSKKNHSVLVPPHYRNYSIQYRPESSIFYSYEQTINVNKIHVNQTFRPQSLTRVSDSSSGVDIIDEESTGTHSSDSEPLIIRYDSASSSPTYSRQVIIRSTDQTVTISNKARRNRRRRFRKRSSKKESICENQSSWNKHRHSSSEQSGRKGDRLKRLFEDYSSEDIHREWKPLTFLESRELYQYAFDKYHEKSRCK